MGIVGDWRLYIQGTTYSWDQRNKTGNLVVHDIEVEADDPTSAKKFGCTIALDASALAIVQGNTVRVDAYSDSAVGWENIFIGEVVAIDLDSGDNSAAIIGYGALYRAATKTIHETTLPQSSLVREQFNAYAINNVALGNVNQLVHVPLMTCKVRAPLIMADMTDQVFNPQVATLTDGVGGPPMLIKLANTLCWSGSDWDMDELVVYVENWGNQPGWAGALTATLRYGGPSVPFAGGTIIPLGAWPLATPPNGPRGDRWFQNRYWVNFPNPPTNIPSGWAFIELEIVGGAGGETVGVECMESPQGAAKLATNGLGVMWAYFTPGPAASDTAGAAGKGRAFCMEIWSPDTWRDWPMGRVRDFPLVGAAVSFDPADKFFGYVIEQNALYNNTLITFARYLMGSIEPTISNVDIFYARGFGTLSGLLGRLYNEYVDDLFDASDIVVTDDIDWPDQEATYTTPLAMFKAICDRSQCSLEAYYHAGTAQTRLRIRDRAEVGDFAGYGAAAQALRTLMHGDDDTTARKDYSNLMSVSYKKDNFRRRDVVVWDFNQKGAENPDATLNLEGDAVAWDAVCGALGRGITVGGGRGGERNDMDPGSPTTSMELIKADIATREITDASCMVKLADIDPVLLANINQAFEITDSRVGLAAEEFLLCGWSFKHGREGGVIVPVFEKDVKWRGPPHPREYGMPVYTTRDKSEQDTENATYYTKETIAVFFNISWAGNQCGHPVSSITHIGIGDQNGTNNLCAFDNMLISKPCTIHDEAGRGKIITAVFELEDIGEGNLGQYIKEVGLLVGGAVIHRRSFAVPKVAGWYYHRHVRIEKYKKYTVIVVIKD